MGDKDFFDNQSSSIIDNDWNRLSKKFPSFSEGGYVSNTDKLAIVHQPEYLIPMDQAIYLLENMSQSLTEIAKTLQELQQKDAENKKV